MPFYPPTIELEGCCVKDGPYVVFNPAIPVRQDMMYSPDIIANGSWKVQSIKVPINGENYGLPPSLFNIVNAQENGGCSTAVLELNLAEYATLYELYKEIVARWCELDVPAKFSIEWGDDGPHQDDIQYVKPPYLINPP